MNKIFNLFAGILVLGISLPGASAVVSDTLSDNILQQRSVPGSLSDVNKKLARRFPTELRTDNKPGEKTDCASVTEASQKSVTSPQRVVTEGVQTVYGLLENLKGAPEDIGMNILGLDGSRQLMWHRDKTVLGDMYDADTYRTGFYRNGDIYLFERSENSTYGHEAYSSNLFVYDFESGKLKEERRLSIADAQMQMFWSTAYDPATDTAYGYTISYDIDFDYQLVKFKPDDLTNITPICSRSLMNTVMALTWHDGYLYGIQYQGYSFVRVDPETGATTVISRPFGDRPIRYSWSGFGMTWVDSLEGFVLNHINNNGTSSLDLLKLDGSLEKICDLQADEQFAFLFTVDEISDSPYTPSKPQIISNTLSGTPDRSGTFSLKMPTAYASGSPIPQDVSIRLEAKSGTIVGVADKTGYAPGETAAVSFSLPDDGMYTFEFKAIVKDGFSKAGIMQYVGYDIPETPENVKLTSDNLSWNAVVRSRNNGYFVPSDVAYKIVLDGVTVAEGYKGTSYAVNFSGQELMSHSATVTAVYMGHESDAVASNNIVDGAPVELDAVFAPTPAQAELFTIVDANEDSATWKYVNEDDAGYFRYYLNTYKDADDWLMTPPVNIPDKNSLYTFSIEANRMAGYPERFEVKMGRTPNPQEWTETLIQPVEVPAEAVGALYQPYNVDFNVEESGKYYFAIHAISEANMHTLKVRDIKIMDARRTTEGPDVPDDIVIIPAQLGVLKADVTMKLPLHTISGEVISPLEDLEAKVSTGIGEVVVKGHPGDSVTVADVPAVEGFNDFTIIVNNGSLGGKSTTIRKYIGHDIPGVPQNLKYVVDETNHGVTLTWDAPAEGANGGYIDASELTYTLCYLIEDGVEIYWQTGEDLGNRHQLKITYDESAPFIDDLGIVARNAKGIGKEVAQAHFSVGRPWKLPMRETFSNFYSQYYPYMILGDTPEYSQSNWGFVDPSKAGPQYASKSGYALVGEGYESGAKGMFAFPKFSTADVEGVSLSFDIYLGTITPDVVDVYAEGPGELGRTKIGSLVPNRSAEDWQQVELSLPAAYCGHGWVNLILDVEFGTDEQKVFIDGFSFKESVANDLAVTSISGPNTPEVGRTNTYSVVIDNIGTKPASWHSGKFVVTCDGREVASADIEAEDSSVEPDKTSGCEFHFTPTADMLGKAKVEFRIVDSDARLANNVISKNIDICRGANIVVTDLKGEYLDGAVQLSWTEPVLDDGVEGFEDSEPFLINDNAAWLGNFRNIDRDGQYTFGTSGWDNPNAGGPAAFSVWDLDLVDEMLEAAGITTSTYSAANGKNLAIAFSCGEGYTTDDWLISPEVVGGSEVSVMLRPISTAYPETVELLYSTDSDTPESFEGNMLKRFTTREYVEGEQIEYECLNVKLPDNARYFAIHYISKDQFAVMIDDIHYSPAKTAEGITGYEIIRNNNCIEDNAPYADCSFRDADVETDMTYSYRVKPLLGQYGSGLESNTVVVATSGVDEMSSVGYSVMVEGNVVSAVGFAGQNLVMSDIQGRVVANRNTADDIEVFHLESGVFLLKTEVRTFKVIVK